ncbi:MAG: DUF2067 family protein [Desulfurococcaceae archaeon]|uniref:DUF2067 domain-containing protein n=1 Tax=Staphylothermus marinus TaxID=2280 RepID=A0A7C4JNS0_STAMA
MPLVKKTFVIPCRGEECVDLSNTLLENISGTGTVTIEAKQNQIVVTIYGYKSEVRETWLILRKLVEEKKLLRLGKGLLKISLNQLAKVLRKTIPPKLLVEVLKRLGYYAVYEKGESAIVTNAPLEELKRISEELADSYSKTGGICRGTTTRYYLAALTVLTGLDLERIVENAEKLNHIYRDEDGKIVVRVEWVRALDEYIKTYRL